MPYQQHIQLITYTVPVSGHIKVPPYVGEPDSVHPPPVQKEKYGGRLRPTMINDMFRLEEKIMKNLSSPTKENEHKVIVRR